MPCRIILALALILSLAGCRYDYEPSLLTSSKKSHYLLDSEDVVRVIVFEQTELTRTYKVDASGRVSVPLAGTIRARGLTTRQLGRAIASRLQQQQYVKDPQVSVEVATYRPFYILGEVSTSGKYPYADNMTVEGAIAIAGGYTQRAKKDGVRLTRRVGRNKVSTEMVPSDFPVRPGDTILVLERWF